MLTSGMRESLEAKVIWDDVEPYTFTGLIQYVYNGTYSAPPLYGGTSNTTLTENSSKVLYADDGEESPEPSIISWMETIDRSTSAKYCFCRQHFNDNKSAPKPGSKRAKPAGWLAKMKDPSRSGHSAVFMLHAKLYTLADRYMFEDLKSLCLDKVRLSLLHVPVKMEVIEAVLEMLQFCDKNDLPREGLWRLLVRFYVVHMGWMKREGYLGRFATEIRGFAASLLEEIPQEFFDSLI